MTQPLEEMTITIEDVRKAGYCVRGARQWFSAHGMNFRTFLTDGIPADEFVEKGDALAARVVALKVEREHRG